MNNRNATPHRTSEELATIPQGKYSLNAYPENWGLQTLYWPTRLDDVHVRGHQRLALTGDFTEEHIYTVREKVTPC